MKINEKNLCTFATTPPFDLEGYLNKRGEVNKAYQRRYFILKGNLLFYFEKKGDKEPLGLIVVEGCTIELSEDGDQYSFQIVFNGNRTYLLSADTQDYMELWMKSLTCAGYEYKKLMVAELQRQLEEIEGTQKKHIQEPILPVAPKPPPRRQNPFNRPAPPPPSATSNSSVPSENLKTVAPTATTEAILTREHKIIFDPKDRVGLFFPNNSMDFNAKNILVPGMNTSSSSSSLHGQATSANHFSSTSSQHSLSSSGCDDETTVFSFRVVHDMVYNIIIKDINDRRKAKENAEKPLIDL